MTQTLSSSVDLLDRALDYTRERLGSVRGGLLDRPTPCADWSLAELLAHMEDSLDAFTEAAGGAVAVHLTTTAEGRVAALQDKACALLGVWSRTGPGDVLVGGLDLGSTVLVATAALEITVHGWDVGQATADRSPIPATLARELLPVARAMVAESDRGLRFAHPLAVAPSASYDVELLAFLGRTERT
ncbi:maleylpyruvate isomerase family mycothiol-dependent enzyme [Nocardioides sp. CN2-186]|uniref:maleylpyruvate isomerase family mycothiol-dependent enzyme n=1 Tax=Nocardioides tweenelious TaxID=3156607 RepID=UPI0032B4F322